MTIWSPLTSLAEECSLDSAVSSLLLASTPSSDVRCWLVVQLIESFSFGCWSCILHEDAARRAGSWGLTLDDNRDVVVEGWTEIPAAMSRTLSMRSGEYLQEMRQDKPVSVQCWGVKVMEYQRDSSPHLFEDNMTIPYFQVGLSKLTYSNDCLDTTSYYILISVFVSIKFCAVWMVGYLLSLLGPIGGNPDINVKESLQSLQPALQPFP